MCDFSAIKLYAYYILLLTKTLEIRPETHLEIILLIRICNVYTLYVLKLLLIIYFQTNTYIQSNEGNNVTGSQVQYYNTLWIYLNFIGVILTRTCFNIEVVFAWMRNEVKQVSRMKSKLISNRCKNLRHFLTDFFTWNQE